MLKQHRLLEEKLPYRITGEGCSTKASALKNLLFSVTVSVYVVHSEVCVICCFFFSVHKNYSSYFLL